MKYKIILKTSHKLESRIKLCLKYWLKDQDVLCATDKIIDLDIPQISASNKDTHGVSSEEKTVFMFNYIKNNPSLFNEYDWFMFIDDDAILNTKMLNFILPALDKDVIYGINMKGAYPKDLSLVYPSGGGGYLVSNKLIKNNPHMINHLYFHEDVSVGRYMRDNNILLGNKVLINGQYWKINMNGWYPFQKIKEQLARQYPAACNDYEIINIVKNEPNYKYPIQNHLTHHYIKTDVCMKFISDIFVDWSSDILLRSNNLI